MKFEDLLRIVGDEPVFTTGLLLAGEVDPDAIRQQLSRWTAAGRLYQFRRGLYALAPPFQKVQPHPFVVANALVHASYVSLQAALAHYGLIPESVPTVTSVTTRRPGEFATPLGGFLFRHVQIRHFRGYVLRDLAGQQQAFVARPEKALLDLIYLHPDGDDPAYLHELRLQNLEHLDLDELSHQTALAASPKLTRAAAIIAGLARAEAQEYEIL